MSPPESDLEGELRRAADATTPRVIDVDVVLGASRARRHQRRNGVLGATASFGVLLAAVGVVSGLQGFSSASQSQSQSTSAEAPAMGSAEPPASGDAQDDAAVLESAEGGAAPRDEEQSADLRLVAPWLVNACGAPVAEPTDAATSPLAVTVEVAGRTPPGASADAVVTVTNTSDDAVEGEVGALPALTLVEDGITVAGSPADTDDRVRAVDLSPGESVELAASVDARACWVRATAGRLPSALSAGDYGITAVVTFTPDRGEPTYLVSPLAPLRIG